MSYEILKYASFSKKEKRITVTTACNNCRPLNYEKWEYQKKDMSFEQNIEYFFVDMFNGNIQGGQKKVKEIYQTLVSYKRLYAPNTDFSTDCKLNTGRDNGLNHLISKCIAVPMVLGMDINNASVIEAIRRYDEESVSVYESLRKQYADKGWLITGSCSRSDVFPGYNVFVYPEGNELLIAERTCYMSDHLGFCDTTKGRVIHLGDNSENFFFMLSNGYDRSIYDAFPDEKQRKMVMDYTEQLMNKLSDLEMGKLPYPEYERRIA